jgi:hypothetical protein
MRWEARGTRGVRRGCGQGYRRHDAQMWSRKGAAALQGVGDTMGDMEHRDWRLLTLVLPARIRQTGLAECESMPSLREQ